jgi:hypothetical protein
MRCKPEPQYAASIEKAAFLFWAQRAASRSFWEEFTFTRCLWIGQTVYFFIHPDRNVPKNPDIKWQAIFLSGGYSLFLRKI